LKRVRQRLTYANVMATAAVFIALGGGAAAAMLPRASVGPRQLKVGAVTGSRLARGAVASQAVKDHSLLARDFASKQLPTGQPGQPGPRGEAGTQGAAGPGVARITVRSATSSAATNSSSVNCQPGERVLGGGYNGMNTGHAYASHPQPADYADTPTGWHAESTSATDVVTVYVLCGAP
jgi:hypothetical protein